LLDETVEDLRGTAAERRAATVPVSDVTTEN
jgi:hypothetical protein